LRLQREQASQDDNATQAKDDNASWAP
jgi:hypothetical protein